MNFKIILSFLIFNTAIGQNTKEVTELVYLNYKYSDLDTESMDHLYLTDNGNRALYISGKRSKINSSKKEQGDVVIKLPSGNGDHIYLNDTTKDSVFYKTSVMDAVFYVKEKMPELNWKLVDEFKDFEGIRLQKAVTSFRGRHYTAWCDLDTPVSAGPWKLSNLPGLAYEVSDDHKEFYYEWYLVRINRKAEVNLEAYDLDRSKMVNLKEFVSRRDALYTDSGTAGSIRSANIPGMEAVEGSVETIDHRVRSNEIIYEWEK